MKFNTITEWIAKLFCHKNHTEVAQKTAARYFYGPAWINPPSTPHPPPPCTKLSTQSYVFPPPIQFFRISFWQPTSLLLPQRTFQLDRLQSGVPVFLHSHTLFLCPWVPATGQALKIWNTTLFCCSCTQSLSSPGNKCWLAWPGEWKMKMDQLR